MSCCCLHSDWAAQFAQLAASFSQSSSFSADSQGKVEDVVLQNSSLTQGKLQGAKNHRILITNGFLYAASLDNCVIERAWILLDGNKITALGDMQEVLPEHDEVINAEGKMILPGLVNPHWHESFIAPNFEQADDSHLQATAYSQGGDIESLGAMFGFISQVGNKLSHGEGLAIARFSLWTQLRSGTTALGDVGSANSSDAMAQAAIDLGLRLRVSRWGSDIMIPNQGTSIKPIADSQQQIDDMQALMDNWFEHPSGLVSAMPSVMGAFGSSDQQLRALKDISQRYKVPVATHLAALKNEREAVERVFGVSSIQRFEQFGLLNEQLLAVHTNYATEDEYQLLKRRGVNICHSPAHYGMLGESSISETGQLGRFLKEGGWLSSSTDGDIDFTGGMCEAMRGAHLNHNEAHNSNLLCPPTLALKTGSLYGAKALGWLDKIGSLEVGKEADIVLVNIDDYRYRLSHHPLRTFLVTGNSTDVDTVIIAGQVLLRESKSTVFEEAELFSDYQKAVKSARQRIGQP